jgi:ubiquinol-cytochrome c reductase cytochrome b subunit
MIRILRRAADWLVDRAGLQPIWDKVAKHPVPPGTTHRRKGWMYVLGIATMTAFLLQVVTGIALATRYIPSAGQAYDSVLYITNQVWGGGFLRGMHFYGASAMVVLITLHFVRVYLTGSYKFPREFQWLTGVVLLLLTMAMAFTGQLLRWDQNGLWGVIVASHYVAYVPLIGEWLREFVLAGQTVGGPTLTRFYVFHVLLLPLLIFAVVGVHMYLVLLHGVSEPPVAGRPVDPKRYREWYARHVEEEGRPYFPDAVWKEAVFAAVMVTAVLVLAFTLGPQGPGTRPDPTQIPLDARPDWFLLWYYALIAIKPPGAEAFVMVYLPLLLVAGMILLPLLRPAGERHPARRPWAIAVVVLFAVVLAGLTYVGFRRPWVMDFATEPLRPEAIGVSSGPVFVGSQLFHEKGCQYCHSAAGEGGAYGPAMEQVIRRTPPEIITTRIINGIGNMPGYRGELSAEELEALLAFIRHLEAR